MMTKNTKKRKSKRARIVLGFVIVVAVAVGIVFSRFGGFGTGPSANAEEFAEYATPISQIDVPQDKRVIALGEATHGNKEFQQLKLDVFKVLVEKNNVRAFALEGDFGGCEVVNRYIHGGEGTAEEAAAAIGFAIYRTDEMANLITWMREYNETAKPDQDLRFYGFDMQRVEHSYEFLLEEAHKLQVDTTDLEKLLGEDGYSETFDADQIGEVYTALERSIKTSASEEDATFALHLIDCLKQNIELDKLVNSSDYSGIRDGFMAKNAMWVLAQEQARGNNCIFISAHNGHIEQKGTYGPDQKVMGSLLADELGEAYYAIGTDFFEAEVNLPKGDQRMTHTFYSYDPLAKAAATSGLETCWLDFSRIPETVELANYINEPIMMGSVGEYFSPLMYVLPQTYRVKREPIEPYDSMILVSHAHPTEIKALS